MIQDAVELQNGSTFHCDICIVGGGPAGLTITTSLLRSGLRVCLLESGGFQAQGAMKPQVLDEQFGVPIDDTKLRKRYLGGASNLWGGVSGNWFRTRPLDPIDFEERSWVPDSGWAIGFRDLAPFYERACKVLGLLPLDNFDPSNCGGPLHPKFHNRLLRTAVFQESKPIRFGQHYASQLKKSQSIRVFVNAAAVDIEAAADKPEVQAIAFVSKNGNRHKVTARHYVLACGGLEVPRLLLASRQNRSRGIGNEHDLVGRYFMQHPKGRHGLVRLKRNDPSLPFLSRVPGPGSISFRSGITFSDALQRKFKVLNHCIMFIPEHAFHEGYVSEAYRAMLSAWQRGQKTGGPIRECLRSLPVRPGPVLHTAKALIGESNSRLTYSVVSHMEQLPNRESRVYLSPEKNELGQWKLNADWQIGTQEKESLCRLHQLAKATIERCGIGSLATNLEAHLDQQINDWPVSEDSAHYIGTTRMHQDPRRGVTDANCRVHGLENLFVSGSSVFPTGGYANPTLTIVALALRLADHLQKLQAWRRVA